MAQDSLDAPKEQKRRTRDKSLSLAPLTFEQALGILAPTVRAPQPETTPAPKVTPTPAENHAHATKTKLAHKRATTTPKSKPQKGK